MYESRASAICVQSPKGTIQFNMNPSPPTSFEQHDGTLRGVRPALARQVIAAVEPPDF
jgi:hypothetical protein